MRQDTVYLKINSYIYEKFCVSITKVDNADENISGHFLNLNCKYKAFIWQKHVG